MPGSGTKAKVWANASRLTASPASRQHRPSGQGPEPQGASRPLTVSKLCLPFHQHARRHYPDSDEPRNYMLAAKALRQLYGQQPAAEIGPRALRAVQAAMVHSGVSRQYVNKCVNRVRAIFKWAASVELLPVGVHQALQTVPPLKRGRTEAADDFNEGRARFLVSAEAVGWYRRAAEQGDPNVLQAVRQAAEQGDERARRALDPAPPGALPMQRGSR